MASNQIDWQIGMTKISSRASKILNSGQWSDCSFTLGTDSNMKTIKGHRLILAMASPVFEAMFYGGMAEKSDKPIEILDVQPQAFSALLKYIYTDELDLSSFDQVCEICYAAKKYMISPLVEECTKFIWKDLHPGNVCRAYEFAKLFEEPQLIEKCLYIIQKKTHDIVMDSSFGEIDFSTLKIILLQDKLTINELTLWEGGLKWAKEECSRQGIEETPINQRMILQDALPLFRFLTLSPSDFANGPALSSILTKEESFGLLMNISSPGAAIMPQNFSSNTKHREPPPTMQHSLPTNTDNMPYVTEPIHVQCTGPITSAFNNEQLIDCTLTFSVDKSVFITGVVLPTQIRPHGCIQELYRMQQNFQAPFGHSHRHLTSRPLRMDRYPELIYAFIQDAQGFRITYTHYSSSVLWENSMEVLFNTPMHVCPHTPYKVVVVLNKMGRYPLFGVLPQASVDGVNFSLEGEMDSSIVKAIIFKM